MAQVKWQCECGQVHGMIQNLSPKTANRCECYCRFCRGFAESLKAEQTSLNANGGSDLFQISPAQVSIEGGRDKIKAIQFATKGPSRFYAACCDTPLINQANPADKAFFSMLSNRLQTQDIDSVLGKVRYRAFVPKPLRPKLDRFGSLTLLKMLSHFLPRYFIWRIRGDGCKSPLARSDGEWCCSVERKKFGVARVN